MKRRREEDLRERGSACRINIFPFLSKYDDEKKYFLLKRLLRQTEEEKLVCCTSQAFRAGCGVTSCLIASCLVAVASGLHVNASLFLYSAPKKYLFAPTTKVGHNQ